MATPAARQILQILKPAPARHGVGFDEYQFTETTKKFPVSATFGGGDSWDSTGLSFDDYARCGTTTRKLQASRILDTPEFAFDPIKLRAVVVRLMEMRAAFSGPQPGTDSERLARAQARLAAQLPKKEEVLTRMCRQFMAMKQDPTVSPTVLNKMTSSIESLDSEIRTLRQPDRGAAQLVGAVNFYYSCGMDSVGVAQQLGIKPPAVRRILWKLNHLWEQMKGEMPAGWRGPHMCINVLRPAEVQSQSAPPKRSRAEAETAQQNTMAGHLTILSSVAERNGGMIPPRAWLFKNGFGSSYQCMMMHPDAFAHLRRSYLRRSKPLKVRKSAVPTPPKPSPAPAPFPARSEKCQSKRAAIVSSAEFIALFEKSRTYKRNRTHCAHGHLICAANAHVGDLKRLGVYACDSCNRAAQKRYFAKASH